MLNIATEFVIGDAFILLYDKIFSSLTPLH